MAGSNSPDRLEISAYAQVPRMTSVQRTQNMRAIRSRDTKPDLIVRRMMDDNKGHAGFQGQREQAHLRQATSGPRHRAANPSPQPLLFSAHDRSFLSESSFRAPLPERHISGASGKIIIYNHFFDVPALFAY
ncbi:hypothetical protein GR247_15990 [Rhizobium leguminosarum]|nr:hypothetical protein [Rhizobium leguminosarum]